MKVVPSQIEFTLPSPKLGIESLPIIDPPWIPKTRTKISTIHESGQVSYYFQSVNRELDFSTLERNCLFQMLLSATKSRKKQQAEAVQSVIHAEAEKRRKERENFHITSVPVLVRAAHEPSLYNGSSEDHEEGWKKATAAALFLSLSLSRRKYDWSLFSFYSGWGINRSGEADILQVDTPHGAGPVPLHAVHLLRGSDPSSWRSCCVTWWHCCLRSRLSSKKRTAFTYFFKYCIGGS